jgi:hypothetical protein
LARASPPLSSSLRTHRGRHTSRDEFVRLAYLEGAERRLEDNPDRAEIIGIAAYVNIDPTRRPRRRSSIGPCAAVGIRAGLRCASRLHDASSPG